MDDIKDTSPASGEQHTGNHPPANAPDSNGPDRFGGSRAGAGNVERAGGPTTNIEKSTDVDRLAPLDEQLDDTRNPNGPTTRTAERDEHGRL